MSAKNSPALGASKKSPMLAPEVSSGGLCKIPKTVFEALPPSVTSSGSGDTITAIRRLDGTIDTNLGSKICPTNPNFVPRQAWPGGNIVTSNKDEALIKYHERKGIPLPEELQKKKEALDKEKAEAAEAKKAAVFSRLGGKTGGGGKAVKEGGAFSRLGDASALPKSKKFSKPEEDEAPSKWASRPKGGVKMLGGAEGAVRGEKRPAEEAEGTEAKRPAN